jgi:nucleoid DNA-binding protein
MHSNTSTKEMIQFIKELLNKNNRVIIPNFGAFIVSQGNVDKILFNNFLSFNDGLLSGYLAETKQIEKSDALIQINEFVEEIRASLESTSEYNMLGLGIFTKDHQGILRFTQEQGLNLSAADATDNSKSSKELLDIDANINSPVEEEKPYEVVIPPSFAKENLLTIDNDKVETTSTPKPSSVDEDANFKKAHRDEPPKPEVKKQPVAKKPVNPRYQDAAKKVEKIEKERKKSSLLLFVILFILLPLIGAGIYFGVYKDKFNLFKAKVAQPTPVEVPKPVEPAVEAPKPEEPSQETKSSTLTPISGSGKTYHIIVRTYNNEQDATSYANKLKEKGFGNAIAFARGSKFLVSIDNGTDLVETEARQEEIVNKYRIESYVLTVK